MQGRPLIRAGSMVIRSYATKLTLQPAQCACALPVSWRDPEECPMTIVSVRLPARPLTLDEVADLADQDPDHRYELQEGNLLVIPPAGDEHAEMIMRIGAWLIAGGYAGRVLATP